MNIELKINKKGLFALDIYAKIYGNEDKLPNVCTYLVIVEDEVTGIMFPVISNQETGFMNKTCSR
jgi:hypothetical protein